MIVHANVRYREDTGFMLRCDRCATLNRACYWPLTLEFWNPAQTMVLCRACHKDIAKARKRITYAASATERAKKREYAREYYASLSDAERKIVLEKRNPRRRQWAAEQRAEKAVLADLSIDRAARQRESNREYMRRYRAKVKAAA